MRTTSRSPGAATVGSVSPPGGHGAAQRAPANNLPALDVAHSAPHPGSIPRPRPLAGSNASLPPLPQLVTRSDQAHRIIVDAISSGALSPHQLVSIQHLADQLGVSRTPVREALLQLVRQGIMQPVSNRGFRVVATTSEDLQDIFEMRMWLEVPAARLAVERARPADIKRVRGAYDAMLRNAKANNESQMWKFDKAFHLALMRASGNRLAALYIEGLRDHVLRKGRLTLGARSMVEIVEDHFPILVAVENGSGADAADAMTAHLAHTAALLLGPERARSRP